MTKADVVTTNKVNDGLVVDKPPLEPGPPSDFDRFAGSLVIEHSSDEGLSTPSLNLIAGQLDARGLRLKQNLQRAQWKPIAEHNLKYPTKAIKTFVDAVRYPRFVRNVRRRLYVARDRYKKAFPPNLPIRRFRELSLPSV